MDSRCPNCGAEVTDATRRCAACGYIPAPDGAPPAAPRGGAQGGPNEDARLPPPDGVPVGSPHQDAAAQEQRAAGRLAATMRLVGWFLTVIGAFDLLGVLTGDLTSLLTGGLLLFLGWAIVRAAGSFGRYAQDGPWQPAWRVQALERLVPVYRIQFAGAVIPVILGVGITAFVWLANAQVGSNISVEELTASESLYESLGDQVYAFKFQGGLVACWVEVESDGVKGRSLSRGSEPKQLSQERSNDLASTFVWTRGPLDDTGAESWRVAMRYGRCESPLTPFNVLLAGQAQPSADQEEYCQWGGTDSSGDTILLGKRRTSDSQNSYESTEIRSPMPAGGNVTLKTIEEHWLVEEDNGTPYHKHVLRIVCRVPEG